MNPSKPFSRIMAWILACVMILTTPPLTAGAEQAPPLGASGEIIAFAELGEEIVNQTVPLGTSMAALTLPGTLTATVRPFDMATPADSGEPAETTEAVPVTWESEPEYDGGAAGTYVFTATVEDYAVSAELPVITVTVGALQNTPGGTAAITFDIPLNESGETAFYLPEKKSITEADLLAGVTATDENGGSVPVAVKDANELDMDNPQMRGIYPNPPYVVTYAAAHPVTEEVFTETRDLYITAGDGSITPMSISAWNGTDPATAENGDFIDITSANGLAGGGTLTVPANATITITGTASVTGPLTFDIGAGARVIWKASLTGDGSNNLVVLTGTGVFEVADGALLRHTGGSNKVLSSGLGNPIEVKITDGEVHHDGTGDAITLGDAGSNVIMTGGKVFAGGGCAIYVNVLSNVTISGGLVYANGTSIFGATGVINATESLVTVSNPAAVIARNTTYSSYAEGSSTGLSVLPSDVFARWKKSPSGIIYTSGANTYSFDVSSASVVSPTTSFLQVNGSGMYNTVAAAETAINNALSAGSPVTVTGGLTTAADMNITIPTGKTLVWNAVIVSTASGITLSGDGEFVMDVGGSVTTSSTSASNYAIEVTGTNAKLTVTYGTIGTTAATGAARAIYVTGANATVNVNGGYVQSQSGDAIYSGSVGSMITVDGGTVSTSGTGSYYAIYTPGSVEVKSGAVSANTRSAIQSTGASATVTVSGGEVTNQATISSYPVINMSNTSPTATSLVTVSGTGKVRAEADNGFAIQTYGSVKVEGDAEVSATTGYAIYTRGTGSAVTVEGGKVSATTGSAIRALGASATVTVSGGEVTNRATSFSAAVIYMISDTTTNLVTVNGTGKVRAEADGGYAIYTYGNVSVEGDAKVSATTGIAIYTDGASSTVMVSGGTVSATTGSAINATGASSAVTVSGGKVSATTGSAIYANGASSMVTVSGGTVTNQATGIISSAIRMSNSSPTTANLVTVSGTGEVRAEADGGCAISTLGSVSVEGGKVSATTGTAIYANGASSMVTVSGGVVFAHRASITGDSGVIYMFANSGYTAPTNDGVVIAWDKATAGSNPTYNTGDTTNLTYDPSGATVAWAVDNGATGISYSNGTAIGFIPITGVTVSGTTTTTVPGIPQSFTATPGDTEVVLSWTAPASDGGATITKYEVSSNNGTSWTDATSLTGHTFTGLSNGTSYTFKVRAVNSVGAGTEASATATPAAPTTKVTFTAVQSGGTSGTTDSTGIVLTFSQAVTGLTANDVTINNGTGAAVKGTLSGSGTTWTIALASVTTQGDVTVSVGNFGTFNVTTGAQTVAVYKDTTTPATNVTFTAVQSGGASGTTDSTGIVITFSQAVTGLTANDITISNGTGAAVKGTLSGSGTTWTIGLTSVTTQGNVTVSVGNFGTFNVTTGAQTVAVYKDTTVPATNVTFTAVQTGGTSGTTDSTGIVLTFSQAVTGLTANDITINNGTGAATKGTLSGSGTTWTIALASVTTQGNVTVSVGNFGTFNVTTGAQTVAVYKDTTTPATNVTFTAVQTGGTSGTTDSTGIVLTFSQAVTGLTASDITISNGTGAAVKGTLSGSGTTWTIALSSVTTQGDVTVSVGNFGTFNVTTGAQTVAVYKDTTTPTTNVTFTAVQSGGASGTTDSTGIVLTFNTAVTGLTANDITISNGTGAAVKGTLSGSGTTWTIGLTSVTTQGNVTVSVGNFGTFNVTTGAQTVAVYKDTTTPTTNVTFTAVQSGGTSGTADSTGIVLTFSQAVTGLTANDITISNGTGGAVKGTLSGSGTTWTIALTSVTTQGNVTVSVGNFGTFNVTTGAQTVAVYKDTTTPTTNVTFTAVQSGGASGTTDSTGIILTFSQAVTGLSASDITINDGTGAVTKGALSGSGSTWTIGLTSVTTQGDVTVSVGNFGTFNVTTGAQTVAVYKDTTTPNVLVTSITVSSSGSAITTYGGTMQMSANVLPANASNKAVTWSISSGSAARVNSSGLLTAINNGSVTVRATANDGSGVYGEKTITIEKKSEQPTMSKRDIKASIDKNGVATVTITEAIAKALIDAANKDAAANGKTADGIGILCNITFGAEGKSINVTIDEKALALLESSGVKRFDIVTPLIKLSFDTAAVKEMNTQTKGTVTITATPVTKLSDTAKKLIGSRPVYDIAIKDSTGKIVSDLKKGAATLGIPYKPTASEKTGSLFIVYVDNNGKPQLLTNSSYNNGWVIWSRNSLSTYGVGYNTSVPTFTDTATHWAKDNIDFVASRELISGATSTTFAPDTAITRGTFLMALGKLSGADVGSYKTSSFTDVQSTDPAMPYIEWAVKNNIVQGIGNNKFGPDQQITREQMAVMMVNYAKATGYKLPVSRQAVTFADNANISTWAKDAVKAIQQTGVISGKPNNLFDPQGSATRAEASAILRRFVELVIDEGTARGWVQNDAGQWQYINVNGKAVTGWLNTTEGNKFWFDDKGVMASGKWVQISGKWYYFYSDGKLAVNTTTDG